MKKIRYFKPFKWILHHSPHLIALCGCANPVSSTPAPPNLSALGTNERGYRIARVITHDHSPYSWDACDYSRSNDIGPINQNCLNDLRKALCLNHVDFEFLSDHPKNMEYHEISELLMTQAGDSLIYTNGNPTANQINSCSDDFHPIYAVGYESGVGMMGLGMNQHLDPDYEMRDSLYSQQTYDVRSQLIQQADALVVIPHTESQTISTIETVQPDAIEIYNIHANVDPKIRMNFLGLSPFQAVARIATYAIDPYHQLNADFAFFAFFEMAPVYFTKWNQLISDNYHVTALTGTDAHENISGLVDPTGERLDSHRRLMRFASNYVLVTSMSIDSVKAAIRKGQTSVVIEGMGVPSGMDFYATAGATTVEIGQSASLASANGTVTLTVKMPSIQGGILKGAKNPKIRMELRKVTSNGQDQVIAQSDNSDIYYSVNEVGAFRTQIYITPRHLKPYLGSLSFQGDSEYPWIITNHIYVEP